MDQQGGDVGDGGYADPSQVNAEDSPGKAIRMSAQLHVDVYQHSQQTYHHQQRQRQLLIMPCHDPQCIEKCTRCKRPANGFGDGTVLLTKLKDDKDPEHQIDNPPDGEGDARRDKQVGVLCRQFAGGFSVDGQGVGKIVHHYHEDKKEKVQDFHEVMFIIYFCL